MSTDLTREQACDKFIAQKMRDGAGGLNRIISRAAFEAGWSARDAEVERLRAAIEAIQSAPIWGHGHWDHTMQRGAGCNLCIEQHKARQQLKAALAGEVAK